MVIALVSFDGFDLNDADFESGFPYEGAPFARHASPITLPVIGGYARHEGFEHVPAEFQVETLIRSDLVAGKNTLLAAMRVGRSGELIIDEDGVQKQRTCSVVDAFPMAGNPTVFLTNFEAADPRWRAAAETEVVKAVTATGQTWAVANAGNAVVDDAVITFEPTAAKAAADSQLYRQFAIIANRSDEPLSDWPLDITDGGINHAALVTAVKSLASGNDIVVLRNGIAIPRFFGEHADTDPNSLTTKVWCTPGFGARATAGLLAAITNVSPATGAALVVRSGETAEWPRKGALVIPSSGEVIRYDGLADPDIDGYDGFLNIKRGQWGTAAAAASAAAALYRVQHKIELVYGWTGAPAPESRPDQKPLLDLASSTLTNLRHEWINWFDDTYPERPGGWARLYQERDAQAGYIFCNRGSPAANADFVYNYYNPPVDRDNFNVLSRRFPTGTSGAAGQLVVNRVVDGTLMAEIRGVLGDGSEHILGWLQGPLTSANFSSTFTQKLYGVSLAVRSQVAISPPEMDGAPLPDQMASSSYYAQVNAINTVASISGAFKNESGELLRISAVQVLVWQPSSPKTDIIVAVRADDGSGAPSINQLALATLASGSVPFNPTWMTVAFARPWPWPAGQTIHVFVQSGAASSSNTLWGHQPMEHAGAYPMRGVRFMSVGGAFAEYARAEGGGGTVYAPAAGDNVTFDNGVVLLDSAGVPYFDLSAEEAVHWANHTLTNLTTGQSLSFDLYIGPSDVVEIDCGRRAVRNVTTDEDGLIYGVTEGAVEGFFDFAPGANTLRWDEGGVAGVEVIVTLRAAWE